MPKPDYEADKEKYGESDLRIRKAGKDPKKLSEAAKQHPDYKGKLEWQGITYDNIGDYQKAIDASGASGRAGHTVGPVEVVAGAVLAPIVGGKAVATYGLDKTLEVGLSALFPDVQDTVLEQGMRAAKLGTAARVSKLSRIAYEKIIKDVFDFRIPNPFKVGEFAGGVGTGFGIGPGDIRPKKVTKKYAQPPAPEPGWTQKAKDAQYPRYQRVTPKGNRLPIAPWEGTPEIKPIRLNKGLNVNVDKMRIVTDLSDLPATQQLTFRNEVRNFLNQADKFAKDQIRQGNTYRPLDGFEYVNLDGVNTGSRSLTDPLGRTWTVRRPSKGKGWQFKNYEDLDTYRGNRTRYDITSSPDEALARRRADAYRTEQNALLKAKKQKLKNKGTDITKAERAWLEANEFTEFYGEHIRRLSRGNPYWRTPEFLKGTMKSGDVANYKIFSNQIEKKFKDQIETILYGKTSGKHYGARYGKTGNELTLGMTNDLQELTIEEILPNGRLKQLGRIPLERAYEEGVNYKEILKEIIGEPPPVIDITYKPVGNKSIPVIRKSAVEIIEEAFSKPRFKDLTKTSERNVERMKRMKGGGTIE